MRNLIFLAMLLLSSCLVYHGGYFAKPSKTKPSLPCRIDGAYYAVWHHRTYQMFMYIFLYRNGEVLEIDYSTPASLADDPDSVRRVIARDMTEPYRNHIEPFYGGFALSGDTVRIQYLHYLSQLRYKTATWKGKVVNDSTIDIYVLGIPREPQLDMPSVHLHFLPMNKPDSLAHNPWKHKRWYWKA